ncbi:MAG: hypothetical protein ACQETL_14850 [Bacteroidota bacterium]
MENINQPLTNAQLEILKAFSFDLSDDDLKELKNLLAKYFAEKAINSANIVWEEKGWNDDKVDDFLNRKLR